MYGSNRESRTSMTRAPSWLFAPERLSVPVRSARRNTSIGGLSFAMEIEGEHVAMRVSGSALQALFGSSRCSSTWLETYRANAVEIEACALQVYRRDPRTPVCLQPSDFVTVRN